MWIARDKDNSISLYKTKPYKIKSKGYWVGGVDYIILPENYFPKVKWEDNEPWKVDLKNEWEDKTQ